jgi:NAD(P)-dependent dehydrogenase (short-subunit alcohol dehydrogenase family)
MNDMRGLHLMGILDGKVAIVFGAGPNIGGTIAHFFAREGARIAVTDIDASASAKTTAFLSEREEGEAAGVRPGGRQRFSFDGRFRARFLQ